MSNFVSKENADSLFGKVGERLELRPKTFTGSHDDWDNLSSTEQAEYQIVNFNDDYSECGSRIIEWSVWSAMTHEQQEAIPDATIVNAPGIDGELKADIFKVLWTNPNPTSAFAAQNITLASDDYDLLLWVFKATNPSTDMQWGAITEKGHNAYINVALTDDTKALLNRRRSAYYTDDLTYFIGGGFVANSVDNVNVADNNACIPISVYGIKKTISLKFDAIASDVSTTADHCMLNSGESVEEKFGKMQLVAVDQGSQTFSANTPIDITINYGSFSSVGKYVLDLVIVNPTVGAQYISHVRYGNQNKFRVMSTQAQTASIHALIVCY